MPYPVLIVISVVAIFFIILILIIKLAKVRQHKTQLETNLAQTKEKNNLLSSQLRQKYHHNMNLKNKLEQERQRIANLERELATDQSRQHNERLTGELTQANQHNEQLTNNLKQEREDKAKLERQLVNLNRSAYQTILEAIYLENSAKTDTQKRECLKKLKEASILLGREYQQQEISPDYSRQDYQEAYLLRYFLPYSQPVPYLLNYLKLKKNFLYQLPEDGTLTASFFGCGPGPELYGLMSYLNSPQSGTNISAAMLDIVPWEHGRKIVRNHLLTRVKIHEFKSNLVGTTSSFLPNDSGKWVSTSDLIVIQHCLNERHNARSNQPQLTENMKQLVAKMKPGAVMLIIERARYSRVRDLLGTFCYELQENFGDSLEIERETTRPNGIEIKPILDVIPKTLANYFFLEESAHSVNSVKFIWVAVAKK